MGNQIKEDRMEKFSTLIICIVAAMMSIANMIGGTARVIISGIAAVLATVLLISNDYQNQEGRQ